MKRLTLILFALLSFQPFVARSQETKTGQIPLHALSLKTIKKSKSGDILVAGWVCDAIASYEKLFLMKCNSQGDVLWLKTYPYEAGGPSSRLALRELVDGQWIIALRFRPGLGGKDFIMKIDQEGKEVWAEYRRYGEAREAF